jgi:hypothetical protein
MNEKPKHPRMDIKPEEAKRAETPDVAILGEPDDEETKAEAPDSKLLVEAGRKPRDAGPPPVSPIPREEPED